MAVSQSASKSFSHARRMPFAATLARVLWLERCLRVLAPTLALIGMSSRTVYTYPSRPRRHNGKVVGFIRQALILARTAAVYSVGQGLGECYTNVRLYKKTEHVDLDENVTGSKRLEIRLTPRNDDGRWDLIANAGPKWKLCYVSRLIAWYYKPHPGLSFRNFSLKNRQGHYNYQADHRNRDSRCNWIGNIRLIRREEHMKLYKRNWRKHLGVQKRPAGRHRN